MVTAEVPRRVRRRLWNRDVLHAVSCTKEQRTYVYTRTKGGFIPFLQKSVNLSSYKDAYPAFLSPPQSSIPCVWCNFIPHARPFSERKHVVRKPDPIYLQLINRNWTDDIARRSQQPPPPPVKQAHVRIRARLRQTFTIGRFICAAI